MQWYSRKYCVASYVPTVWRGPSPVSAWRCPHAQTVFTKKSFSVNKLDWPAQSSEIIPHPTPLGWIGTWAKSYRPASVPGITNVLVTEREQIPATRLQNLVGILPRRVEAVIVMLMVVMNISQHTVYLYAGMFVFLWQQCFLTLMPIKHIWTELTHRETREWETKRWQEREVYESEQRATTHRSRQHTLSHSAESQHRHKRCKCHLG